MEHLHTFINQQGYASLVTLGVSASFALYFGLAYCYQGPSWPKTIVKTIPVGLLAIIGFVIGGASLLVLALALSALGDYALSRPGQRSFLIGLVSFALAHVAFIISILELSDWQLNWTLWIVVLGLGLMILALALLDRHTGALRWPVRVYVTIIATMVVVAGIAAGRPNLVFVSALTFAASDFILSIQMFRMGQDHPWQRPASIILWSLYYLAQVGFLIGLLAFANPVIPS